MFSCLFSEDVSRFLNNDDIDEYGDYSLDSRNIGRFLKECNEDIRPIIQKILDKTKYISFMEFMKTLFKSVRELVKNIDRKNIYIYECSCKCNRWMFKYIYRMIKFLNPEIKVKIITDKWKNFKDDDFIILPFDCLYTGFQITKNTKILCNNNKNKKSVHIYVLSPFMSSYGIFNMKNRELEKEYHYKLIIGSHTKIDEYLITEVLNFGEIALLSKYYPTLKENEKYSSNLENIYFFYFNHKIGDLNTTITLLYMGVIPNDFNRMALLDKKPKLQILPIIKNCNFVYNSLNIDTQNPICPPPVY